MMESSSDSFGRVASTVNKRNTKHSVIACIDQSSAFQTLTLMVICINAGWLSIDVQFNHQNIALEAGEKLPLEPWSAVIESCFCAFFFVELLIRFFALKRKCRPGGWFIFDFILVFFMVIESWMLPLVDHFSGAERGQGPLANFGSFRLLRLLRLTRMARIMRFCPEVLTIVKGIVNATKAVFFILFFLIVVMYVFAIFFTSQLGRPGVRDLDPGHEAIMLFDSIGSSMMTLFTNGVLGDNLWETLQSIKDTKEGVLLMWLFMIFLCVSSVTLLNMLIGVLCQVVGDTARLEKTQNQMHDLQACLTQAFRAIDQSQDNVISADEWAQISSNPVVRKALIELGIEEEHLDERLIQMHDTLFGHGQSQSPSTVPEAGSWPSVTYPKGLTYQEFISKIVDLRWDTPTNALDLEIMRNHIFSDFRQFKAKLDGIERKLERALADIKAMKIRRGGSACPLCGCDTGAGGGSCPSNVRGDGRDPGPGTRQGPGLLLDVSQARHTGTESRRELRASSSPRASANATTEAAQDVPSSPQHSRPNIPPFTMEAAVSARGAAHGPAIASSPMSAAVAGASLVGASSGSAGFLGLSIVPSSPSSQPVTGAVAAAEEVSVVPRANGTDYAPNEFQQLRSVPTDLLLYILKTRSLLVPMDWSEIL